MKTPGGFTGDPIPLVVAEMMRESWLYCFDEMQCSDIADAMILRRLFEGLMSQGAVVVATSNRIPDDLYKNGLQREFFVPFIHLIHERCTVHHLASKTDYRLTGHMASKTYMSPINDQTVAAADELFRQLTHNEPLSDATLNISGRSLRVPECARGVARFTFDELCRRPLGASDYLTLAAHFHTVFIVGVPRMTLANRTEARRLILLIDALYDHRCKTVFVAEDVPALLFRGKPRDRIDEMNKDAAEMMDEMDPTKAADASKASVFTGEDEVFAFDRCVSRMMEMQSTEYLESMHKTTTELIAS
jgi:protein AFG1